MKRLLLIITLILSGLSLRAQYDVHHYSVDDGLSQNTIMSITQDHDGYMWFGTWDGLNKFDGYEFTVYKSNPDQLSLRNNRVDFISEDSLGYIWFQTYDGHFHRFDKSREKFYTLDSSFPLVRYYANRWCIEPRKGVLFFVSSSGILRVKEKTNGEIEEKKYDLSCNTQPHFIINDSYDRVWYDDGARLCRRSISGEDSVYLNLPATDQQTIITTTFVSSNSLWFGTNQGRLWRYSLLDNRFETVFLGKETEITDIVQLSQYEMMFGTKSDGLFVYHALTSDFTQVADAKKLGSVVTLKNDDQGVVWIENDQPGIWRYRISDQSLKHLQPEIDERYSPLKGNMIVLEDSQHNIWVNPYGGGFSRYNSETDELENPLPGIPSLFVRVKAESTPST